MRKHGSLKCKLLVFAIKLSLFVLSACDVPAASMSVTDQPPSPLNPEHITALVFQRWTLESATSKDEDIQFDAVKPFEIRFKEAGTIEIHPSECSGGGAYSIYFSTMNQYSIGRGDFALEDCGEIRLRQNGNIANALEATNRLEMDDGKLILSGSDVRMVLTSESP